jgi:hypothetical protein
VSLIGQKHCSQLHKLGPNGAGELSFGNKGLEVTVCSVLNETWYIKDDGLFTGYIASGAELLELKSANKLNIRGIKSLGQVVANWVLATADRNHR